MQQTMCLRFLYYRQGILASYWDSYGRRGVEGIQLSSQGKSHWLRFQCSLVLCCTSEWKSHTFKADQSTHSQTTITATSKSHMSWEIQRAKIILDCTFVLIKSIKSFRAIAAYEWEKSEFYAKSRYQRWKNCLLESENIAWINFSLCMMCYSWLFPL